MGFWGQKPSLARRSRREEVIEGDGRGLDWNGRGEKRWEFGSISGIKKGEGNKERRDGDKGKPLF